MQKLLAKLHFLVVLNDPEHMIQMDIVHSGKKRSILQVSIFSWYFVQPWFPNTDLKQSWTKQSTLRCLTRESTSEVKHWSMQSTLFSSLLTKIASWASAAKSKFWVPSPSAAFSRSWDTSLFKSGKNIPRSKKTWIDFVALFPFDIMLLS